MRRTKSAICGLLIAAIFILLPITAFAATGTQDGLNVTMTTDKASYAAGDTVTVNVSVENTNAFAVNNIKLELTLPSGLSLKTGSATLTIASLAAGATETHSFTAVADAANAPSTSQAVSTTQTGGSPQTGDDSNLSLWVVLLVVSVGLLVAGLLLWKKRKGAKFLSMFLCFALLTALAAPALPVRAATVTRDFTVSESVTVNGASKQILLKTSYDWTVVDEYTFNTPAAVTKNGVTATVSFDKTNPQATGTAITATVTLSGTATAAGTFSIDLTSAKAGLATNVQTKVVTVGATPTDVYHFTFTMPAQNVDDLALAFTFAADATYALTVNNLSTQASATYGSVSITNGAETGNVAGTSVTVTAAPAANHVFVGWASSDDRTAVPVSTDAAYTFNINADTTLYAVFNGDGTGAPIDIATKEELVAVEVGVAKNYRLVNDIDAGNEWMPIGNSSSDDDATRFTGIFDGNGHKVTISGVSGSITPGTYDQYYIGLFGVLGAGGSVKNLTVEGVISASPDKNSFYGGIAGFVWGGSINDCISHVNITATGNADARAGGIAGQLLAGSITNCYATGSIVTDVNARDSTVGGIVGYLNIGSSGISNCVALNSVVQASGGTSSNCFGRLVGYAGDTISYSYASSAMTDGTGGTNWQPSGSNSADANGDDCEAVPAASWWTTTMSTWDWVNVWDMQDGQLPTLR